MLQVSSAPRSAPPRPRPAQLWPAQVAVGVVLTAIVFLRAPAAEFIYDAADYFDGARALLDGRSVFEEGGLGLRGVLTAFLFLPAALITSVGGDGVAGAAVLAQNAVHISLVGVVLIPRLVAIWRPMTPAVVIASAVGTGVALAGFAPFPLSDLWGATLLLAVVVALDHGSRPWLIAAGLAAGAAVNVRPATLLPLAAIGLAVLVARRWSAGWFVVGGGIALLPQFVLNRWRGTMWAPVPERTGWLTELQASYASYLVRYDTVVADPATPPSLFWCSPDMAQALDGTTPSSPGELAGTFLAHLPSSVVFSAQKIGAALHWPLSAPYLTPAPVLNAVFAVLITTVTVVGAAVLLRRTLRQGRCATLGQVAASLAWTGSLVGLVTSATETRFALPLVVLGIVGCALLAGDALRAPRSTAARAWVAGTLVVVLATYGVGLTGMRHPFDDGGATVALCADS